MRIGRVRTLADCHNIADFRELAQRRLPFPVFHYIDGGGDDEATKARNTSAFDDVDLVPDVLVNVESIDTSVTVLGKTTRLPLMLSPTAASGAVVCSVRRHSPRITLISTRRSKRYEFSYRH